MSSIGGPSESVPESSVDSKDTLGLAPSKASSTTPTTSNSSLSSSKEKDNHSNHSFSSFFHHRDHHDPREHSLSSMLIPTVNVAGAHNPFAIGGLREDGSRTRPSLHRRASEEKDGKDDGASVASEDTSRSSRKKASKRHRLRSAFGRSLSPWRYHFDEKKRSGASGFNRLNCRDSLDVEREKKGGENGDDREDGTESDGESVKGGIIPRNSAFGNVDSEEDSEEEMEDNYASERRSRRAADGKEEARKREDEEEEVREVRAEGGRGKGSSESDGDSQRDEGEDSGEESDDYIDFDEQTLDNTLFNAGCIDLHDAWLQDDNHSHSQKTPDRERGDDLKLGDGYYGPDDYDAAWDGAGPTGHDENDEALTAPNVVIGQSNVLSPSELSGEGMEMLKASREKREGSLAAPSQSSPKSSKTPLSSTSGKSESNQSGEAAKATSKSQILSASRPIFERNRCTITLLHGEYERLARESKRPKRYIVASDGSEESSHAIEWTIGTVLRDGDEMLVVSVMETDAKLDSVDAKHEDKMARQEHQRIRQSMAVVLARRATSVLQRTRLAVKVSCQALHARNSRHMFIDMIDFFEPTMCVVGSRGLNSLKGVLLGSFSNYCVQKSPVPVMVARKRLKLPALPKGKGDVVNNVRARHMRLDEASIEKDANVADEKPGVEQKEESKEEEREDGTQETTEAEKVKEAATQRQGEGAATEAAATEAKGGEDEGKGDSPAEARAGSPEKASGRGRSTFPLETGDDSRGRSRSRTSEKQEST